MKRIGIVTDDLFKRHDNGAGHPESPSRLDAVERGVRSFTERVPATRIAHRQATVEELELVHEAGYVERIADTAGKERTILDPETQANRFSFDTAARAAGAAVDAAKLVLAGELDVAFCATRPPGHHAEAARAMGFRIFNNVAIAARWAVTSGAAARVAIIDWDVHHGNGTMHSLYEDPSVLYVSLHQSPHYPGTGATSEIGRGPGEGYTVNFPLPPGCGDADYSVCFDEVVLPVLAAYEADLLIVSAGYDAHRLDPLASMQLSSRMYRTIASRLAGTMAGGSKIVAVLEGGYDLTALEEGTAETLVGLAEADAGADAGATAREDTVEGEPSRACREVVRSVVENLGSYWPALATGE